MLKRNRDEFSAKTRHQIERKSAFLCSNPSCRRSVIGPSEDFQKVVYMGVVAHICAAAPNGPRYDPAMSAEERGSEENGLLLCRYCASLVDVDEISYPAELLRLWKRQAYQQALERLSTPGDNGQDTRCWQTVRELVRVCLCTYQTQGQVSKDARFRSYAGILYRLFFQELPQETDFDAQNGLWTKAVESIAHDVLVSVRVRTAHHNRSFPTRYRYLMEELQTYHFVPEEQKARTLNIMEAAIQELFQSGAAFGLKENNGREPF